MGPRDFPENLNEFALIPQFELKIEELASLAEGEDWDYHNTNSDTSKPILHNYIKYTYKRLAEERKISVTDDDKWSCWNTGLVTHRQEPIFILFEENKFRDKTSWWHFYSFARKGQHEMSRFSSLPDLAHYFDDPGQLVFDVRRELRVNYEHIIADNKKRFPSPYSEMDEYQLQTFLKGLIDNAIERVRRNYKTAIPQYYRGRNQLLLPLCLSGPSKADLAMVVENLGDFYRASTCLTLDMAYNNARQLARPDRDWLQP